MFKHLSPEFWLVLAILCLFLAVMYFSRHVEPIIIDDEPAIELENVDVRPIEE